jgi:hypothetical protein
MTACFRPDSCPALSLLLAALVCAGCGTPGAPLAPSLKLPDAVTNLAAVRTGDEVALSWTMAKRNTDKLLIKGDITVRVCRQESSGVCAPVAATLLFAPGARATFMETLPVALATGTARPLSYFVELMSPRGRSAGRSNAARVVAGEAPAAIANLSAQLRKDGVVFHWTPEPGAEQSVTLIRLHRTLLAQPAKVAGGEGKARQGFLAATTEPLEQTLLVDSSLRAGRAIDKTIVFGRTYLYRAQRVARVAVDGQLIELAGPLSDPVRVDAIDVFPPAIPTGLAAVATAPGGSTPASIDLSWLPVSEADLAGYAVYRREGDGGWRRISPPQPVVGPGFHDAEVERGHTYRYAVTAIDQLGHESARSGEAEESFSNP